MRSIKSFRTLVFPLGMREDGFRDGPSGKDAFSHGPSGKDVFREGLSGRMPSGIDRQGPSYYSQLYLRL